MALIANLRHYLGDDLSQIKSPAPAAGLREFLGCIVETVTCREPDDQLYYTTLKCRKKCKTEERITRKSMLTGSQNRRNALLTNCPNYVEKVH
jgi:hypothetical protein